MNVKLAYLQSNKPLIRKIFINNLAPEFDLSSEEVLKLLKLIYTFTGSDDEWHRVLDVHIQIDLDMTPRILDSSLFCKFQYNELFGLNRSYIDDLLHAGMTNGKQMQTGPWEGSKSQEMSSHHSLLLECTSQITKACST